MSVMPSRYYTVIIIPKNGFRKTMKSKVFMSQLEWYKLGIIWNAVKLQYHRFPPNTC